MIQQIFHSEKIHGSSNSPTTHDIVSIKNGKGYKLREVLTPKGKVAKRTRKNLKPTEIRHIMNGRFLPGLWRNCGNASGKKSRRNSRR